MTELLTRPAAPPRTVRRAARGRRLAGLLAAVCLLVGLVVLRDGPGALTVTGTAPEGVGNTQDLQPAVRRAVERAIAAATADGVELRVTSGWRSAAHQRRLFDEAVAKHGSAERARQWVLPPGESEHVRGGAVDVGPQEGARWLDEHGERWGLCRRYDNEPWHFERLAGALGSTCPPREPHA